MLQTQNKKNYLLINSLTIFKVQMSKKEILTIFTLLEAFRYQVILGVKFTTINLELIFFKKKNAFFSSTYRQGRQLN